MMINSKSSRHIALIPDTFRGLHKILLLGILSMIFCAGQKEDQGLIISENGRYFETSEGEPFFWFGDTNWVLFHRTNLQEAEVYFADRAEKGFNVIQASLCGAGVIEGITDSSHNLVNGLLPFHFTDSLPDPERPDEDFFRHADRIIELAKDHGLYIGILPTWGEFVCPAWHNGPDIFNPENARSYGEFLGKRYKEHPNIIWILGGDRNPYQCDSSDIKIWQEMAVGIKKYDTRHLMTYHPKGNSCSCDWFHKDNWLDFNMYQSIRWPENIENLSRRAWGMSPTKPVVNGEPFYYENRQIDPDFDERVFRSQPYWSFITGARGYTFGQHHVWFFDKNDPYKNFENNSGVYWYEKLDTRGTRWAGRAIEIIRAHDWWNFVPDTLLITGDRGTGTEEIMACRLPDYSQLMVYFPTAKGTKLDIERTAAPFIELTWFKTDEKKEIRYIRSGSMLETGPPEGWEDALLIVKRSDKFTAGFETGGLGEIHSVHTDPGGGK